MKKKLLKLIWPLINVSRRLIFPLKIWKVEKLLYKNYNKHNQQLRRHQLYFMIDENFSHGGLLDKIKGIISIYFISKKIGADFKIFLNDNRFPLHLILNDNLVWLIDNENCNFSRNNSKPKVIYNYIPKRREILYYQLKKKIQYHIYCNMNLLPLFYEDKKQWENEWRSCFRQFFDEAKIKSFSDNTNNPLKYDFGIHLRFMSLLGDFTDVRNKELEFEEQIELMDWCVSKVLSIIKKFRNKSNFLLVSDSKKFLLYLDSINLGQEIKQNMYFNIDDIGHSGILGGDKIFRRAVLDFYLLSKCDHVFLIKDKRMHNSDFSRFAAILGNKTFTLLGN